jgi:hypothetical protein
MTKGLRWDADAWARNVGCQNKDERYSPMSLSRELPSPTNGPKGLCHPIVYGF